MSSSKDATYALAWYGLAAGTLVAASWALAARYLSLAVAPLAEADGPDSVAAMTRLIWGFALFGVTVGTLAVYGLVHAMRRAVLHMDALDALRAAATSRWHALAANQRDVIMTLDSGGTILSASRPVSGVTPELLAGRALFDFIPHEHEYHFRRRMADVLTSGEPSVFEFRGASIAGGHGWTEHRLAPTVADDGGVILLLVARDLTPLRRMERELTERYEARAAAVVEPIPPQVTQPAPRAKRTTKRTTAPVRKPAARKKAATL